MDNIIVSEVIARSAHLPKTISLAVPRQPIGGAMLKIMWEMGSIGRPAEGWQLVKTTVYSRPPDTYIWLPLDIPARRWHEIVSEAGWYLGSDYMTRWIFAACDMPHLWGLNIYATSCGYFSQDDPLAGGDNCDAAHAAALNYGAVVWEIESRWLRYGTHNAAWFTAPDPETNDQGLRLLPWAGWAAEHGWFGGDQPAKENEYLPTLTLSHPLRGQEREREQAASGKFHCQKRRKLTSEQTWEIPDVERN